ncbi:MAG TPA: glycosyltransferase [Desulfobacteria bacterium]|nr:glycosyltransferase [Desulfobacteria bacterium]
MRTLQVGNTDNMGSRFNGKFLHHELLKRGVESELCVWDKNFDDDGTWQMADYTGKELTQRVCRKLEKISSIQSLLYPFSWSLLLNKRFQKTDLVHYHLIHTGYFSIGSFPALTAAKPSVWTIHDSWAMTGHCITPYDCQKWIAGCKGCDKLDTPMPMKMDNSALMWKIKKFLFNKSDIDVIVASKYMLNMAQQSPLFSNFRLHHIPFGLDLSRFKPVDKEKAKREMWIYPGSFVIAFRATTIDYKGLNYIKEALHKLDVDRPVCLLTFDTRDLLKEFRDKYQIIDLGWVEDEDLVAKAYNASDVFLMPSTGEAFGMMAIEAMSCGTPVITFEGTALPDVIFAPHGGIALPKGDTDGLKAAIEKLISEPEELKRLSENVWELVKEHYDSDKQINKMIDLYKEVIARRKAGEKT